jgi:hypothetical protein
MMLWTPMPASALPTPLVLAEKGRLPELQGC